MDNPTVYCRFCGTRMPAPGMHEGTWKSETDCELEQVKSKLDTIRLKCLDELKHKGLSPFEEGRMDFADLIWRMIVQEPPK